MRAWLAAKWWALVQRAVMAHGFVLRDAVAQGRVEGVIESLAVYASEESGGLNDNRMPPHARKFVRAAARNLSAHAENARRAPTGAALLGCGVTA